MITDNQIFLALIIALFAAIVTLNFGKQLFL